MTTAILYVDSLDQHLKEDNCIVIHPQKLPFAKYFQKSSFDKVIIKNSKTEYLKSLCLFNLSRLLKKDGICEIYIDQPINVMLDLEKDEIEANAKLGGFTAIKSQPFEYYQEINDKQIKIQTIKISMIKDDK